MAPTCASGHCAKLTCEQRIYHLEISIVWCLPLSSLLQVGLLSGGDQKFGDAHPIWTLATPITNDAGMLWYLGKNSKVEVIFTIEFIAQIAEHSCIVGDLISLPACIGRYATALPVIQA